MVEFAMEPIKFELETPSNRCLAQSNEKDVFVPETPAEERKSPAFEGFNSDQEVDTRRDSAGDVAPIHDLTNDESPLRHPTPPREESQFVTPLPKPAKAAQAKRPAAKKKNPEAKAKPKPKCESKPKKPRATTSYRSKKSELSDFKFLNFKTIKEEKTSARTRNNDSMSSFDSAAKPVPPKKRKLANLAEELNPPTAYNTPAPPRAKDDVVISEIDLTGDEDETIRENPKKFFKRAKENLMKINKKRTSADAAAASKSSALDVFDILKSDVPVNNTATYSYRRDSVKVVREEYNDVIP